VNRLVRFFPWDVFFFLCFQKKEETFDF